MSSTRPLFALESGSMGIWVMWRMVVCLGLRFSRICKFLGEQGAQAEVPLNIQVLWDVAKRATRDAYIGDEYGVGLEDEEEDRENEGLHHASKGASSSYRSTIGPTPSGVQSLNPNPTLPHKVVLCAFHAPFMLLPNGAELFWCLLSCSFCLLLWCLLWCFLCRLLWCLLWCCLCWLLWCLLWCCL